MRTLLHLTLLLFLFSTCDGGGDDQDGGDLSAARNLQIGELQTRIDGNIWKATASFGAQSVGGGFRTLSISALTDAGLSSQKTFSIYLFQTSEDEMLSGQYDYDPDCSSSPGIPCLSALYVDETNNYLLSGQTAAEMGTLNIEFYDGPNGPSAAGTFSMVMGIVDESGTLEFTDGKFNVMIVE
ncbi:hypothetical protein GGR28_000303 [Lewinella aquimaris]|uniref:Uncharacterized protein n=1 Tax=Neolewinella aquimaris TaxID=1835722 RepID=A0A840E1R8_9BACT|nr:hypothetical protein [Neolewinella aquimaris]MBB4077702.1 hypothetical protein [Neolewinella aquimaris]